VRPGDDHLRAVDAHGATVLGGDRLEVRMHAGGDRIVRSTEVESLREGIGCSTADRRAVRFWARYLRQQFLQRDASPAGRSYRRTTWPRRHDEPMISMCNPTAWAP